MISAIIKAIKAVVDAVAKIIAWLLVTLGLWIPALYSLVFVIIVVAFTDVPLANTGTVYFFGLVVALLLALWFAIAHAANRVKKKKRKNGVEYNVSQVKKKKTDEPEPERPPIVKSEYEYRGNDGAEALKLKKDEKAAEHKEQPPEQTYTQPEQPYREPNSSRPAPETAPQQDYNSTRSDEPRYDDGRRAPQNFDAPTGRAYNEPQNYGAYDTPRDRNPQNSFDNAPQQNYNAPRYDEPRYDDRRRSQNFDAPTDRYNNEPMQNYGSLDTPRDRNSQSFGFDNAPRDRGRAQSFGFDDAPQQDYNAPRYDEPRYDDRRRSQNFDAPTDRYSNEPMQNYGSFDTPRDRNPQSFGFDNSPRDRGRAQSFGFDDAPKQDYNSPRYDDRRRPQNFDAYQDTPSRAQDDVYMRDKPVADEQPRIFKLRDDPDMLVYEYSDRLDYYRRTAHGNEFIRRKFK